MGFCCAKEEEKSKIGEHNKSGEKKIHHDSADHKDSDHKEKIDASTIVKTSHVQIDRKSYCLGADEFKMKFPNGEHELELLVTVTDFSSKEIGDHEYRLMAGRGKNHAEVFKGKALHHGSSREGAVEVTITMYFHDDGIPHDKNGKLEIFVGDESKGHARFDFAQFYSGDAKELTFKNSKKEKVGKCEIHVKVVNKNLHPLVEK